MSEPLLYARTLGEEFRGREEWVLELCQMPEPVHARTTQVPSSCAGMAKTVSLCERQWD